MRPLLTVLALGVAAALQACSADTSSLEPLVGRWTTTSARFEGCAMEFTGNGFLFFDRPGGDTGACRVSKVECADGNDVREFHIAYESAEGGVTNLELVLAQDGSLRLRNQNEAVWQREQR